MKKRLYICSDLHYGRDDCLLELDGENRTREFLESQIKHADIVVLNGDLVHAGSGEMEKAKRYKKFYSWLAGQVTEHPQKQFYIISGNHERGNDAINDRVTPLCKGCINITHHSDAILLGDMLITHGDLIYSEQTSSNFKKPDRKSTQTDGLVCDFSNKLLKRMYAKNNLPLMVMDIENGENKQLNEEMWSHVQHISYAHTHFGHNQIKMDDRDIVISGMRITVNGKSYYNSGATVLKDQKEADGQDLDFHGLTALYDPEEGVVTNIQNARENIERLGITPVDPRKLDIKWQVITDRNRDVMER